MELITDIPRLYTGLAEWAGCLIMLLICRRKVSNAALIAISMAAAVLRSASPARGMPLEVKSVLPMISAAPIRS
jgi:hypothetical protein